jgi:drug/metabolite transporter (DMT)-like permease
VIGVVGGLLTALLWSGAGTCSARVSRAYGPLRALALGNLIGVVAVPLAALVWVGPPASAPWTDWLRALVYGLGTTCALASIFRAYRLTKLGLVSATVSTNGTIAALVSVAVLGEHLRRLAFAAVLVTGAGVAAAALREETHLAEHGDASDRRGMAFALLGALGFAIAVLAGSGADELQPIWIVACGRVIGFLAITVPAVSRGRLPRPTRPLLPYVIGSPVFDAAGFATLLVASRDGVAVPAVLATLSVVFLALVGALAFRERLGRLQWAGVALTVLGVAALAATR